ncbi:MAG: hypothetical protein AB8I08_01645 [Sandaracinaceae bacterium]
MDAFRPPVDATLPTMDAGPGPACVGTSTECMSLSVDECLGAGGCELGTCQNGVISRSCSSQTTAAGCTPLLFCDWDPVRERCTGSLTPCSSHQSREICIAQRCDWTTFDDANVCRGRADRCTDRTLADCESQPGCALADWVDAGPGGVDAGTGAPDGGLDAAAEAGPGASCAPLDGCNPLYDQSCGCGYSNTTFDWQCGRSSGSGSGGSCDTSADCGVGLFCPRTTNDGAGVCRRFCDEDEDCGEGEGCALMGEITGVRCAGFCLPLEECSLRLQNCGADACYWLRDPSSGRDHRFCNPEGSGPPNDFCNEDATACDRGLVCVRRPARAGRCSEVCETDTGCTDVRRPSCSGVAGDEMYCR